MLFTVWYTLWVHLQFTFSHVQTLVSVCDCCSSSSLVFLLVFVCHAIPAFPTVLIMMTCTQKCWCCPFKPISTIWHGWTAGFSATNYDYGAILHEVYPVFCLLQVEQCLYKNRKQRRCCCICVEVEKMTKSFGIYLNDSKKNWTRL